LFEVIRSYSIQYKRMATAPSDLTGAARIREAALRAFATRGVAGTSIRDVARAAGVSPGLVQHHFRSKAGLRRAVDDFVMRRAIEAFGELVPGSSPAEDARELGARIAGFIRTNPPVFAYIGRSLLEGDAPGGELLERLLVLARAQVDQLADEKLLRLDLDRDWAALHVILINVGAFLVEPALRRHLGASLLSAEGLARMERATTALFLEGIYRAPRRQRGRTGRR